MRLEFLSPLARLAAVTAAATALSACVTMGGSLTAATPASPDTTTNATASTQTAAVLPVNQPRSSAGMLEVEPLNFDPDDAPRACVNDLRIYGAYLQMPNSSGMNLNKPINDYIHDAGGADAALNAANAQVIELRQQLDSAVASRDPFDMEARKDSDDVIATLEDGILLNQALAEAIECRRGNI